MPTPFERAVLRRVRKVPRGRVTTYGDVADAVGRPGAARAVGAVLRAGDEDDVPYHRVVGAGGRMAGGGARERARRLRVEGLRVASDGRIAGFARARWPDRDRQKSRRRSRKPRKIGSAHFPLVPR